MSAESERLEAEEVSSTERPFIPDSLPVLPLRDTVLFPNSFMPLAVAREASVRLIDESMTGSRLIAVFTQRDATVEEPTETDLYEIGTATHIHKMFKLPDGSLRLIVQGLSRVRLKRLTSLRPYLLAEVEEAAELNRPEDRLEIDALQRNIKTSFQQIVSLSPLLSDDLQTLALNITEPGKLADFIISSLPTLTTAVKQEVLDTLDVRARMDLLNRILIKELEVLELGSKIQSQVQSEVGKNQREYFLREQLKAIQKELGEDDDQAKEIDELREKIQAAGMPEAVLKEATRELDRLSKMPVAAAEYTVSRTYLDWLVVAALDQADRGSDRPSQDQGRPRRRSLRPGEGQGSHPRVPGRPQAEPEREGADSLLRRPAWRRQDVAGALDRHARSAASSSASRSAACATKPRSAATAAPTSGRCPARWSRACAAPSRATRCSSSTRSTSSAPTSAVTRRRRCSRSSIRSRTSRSAIITSTCRSISPTCSSSPRPTCSIRFRLALRDRMEVLELAGYTEEEKLQIAREHLVAKQVTNHGLTAEQLTFTDEAIAMVIRGYTREAGVRNLERELGALCRKVARRRAEGDETAVTLTRETVATMLGAPRFLDEEVHERTAKPGVAIGLAWTPAGGDVLFVEATRMHGGATLTLTGHLGDVMKESARAALSWVRRNADRYGLDADFFKAAEIHVHVPSGAIPKDGPSAGVTIATALVSELTGRPIRGDIAMTGEITLSRQGAARRWHQGEGAGGAPRRRSPRDPAAAEREERARRYR